MIWRPLKGGRQHRTPAAFPKGFQEEPSRMLSRGRQNMRRYLWPTRKISRKFAEE